MIDAIVQAFAVYYGLDWGALCFGIFGCYFITCKNPYGFILSILGCCCGFAVAVISNQYGFIVYNIILIAMMARGFIDWRRDRLVRQAAE